MRPLWPPPWPFLGKMCLSALLVSPFVPFTMGSYPESPDLRACSYFLGRPLAHGASGRPAASIRHQAVHADIPSGYRGAGDARGHHRVPLRFGRSRKVWGDRSESRGAAHAITVSPNCFPRLAGMNRKGEKSDSRQGGLQGLGRTRRFRI